MTSKGPNILLHGSGAIGTIYVYLLQQGGATVTAVCRSNYAAASTSGFTINSAKYGNDIHIKPQIARSPAEAAQSHGPFDYIVVCTKSLPEARTAEAIRPAVTEGKTTIVLIQNGVGIEEEFSKAFPKNPLLSSVVYLPTTQVQPGVISMGGVEMLEVGTFPAEAYEADAATKTATDRFLETLKKGRSNVTFYPDVQEKRWLKLMLNASWNPICGLTLSRDVAFLASSPDAAPLVMDVMQEVIAVARKLGYTNITPDSAHKQLKRATSRTGKGIEPSMLVDVLTARRMEVEVILGNPVRIAREVGVPVPKLEVLYALAKALDEAIALRQPGQSLAGDETKAAATSQL